VEDAAFALLGRFGFLQIGPEFGSHLGKVVDQVLDFIRLARLGPLGGVLMSVRFLAGAGKVAAQAAFQSGMGFDKQLDGVNVRGVLGSSRFKQDFVAAEFFEGFQFLCRVD